MMSYAVYSDDVRCEGAVFKSSRQCHEKAEKLKGKIDWEERDE